MIRRTVLVLAMTIVAGNAFAQKAQQTQQMQSIPAVTLTASRDSFFIMVNNRAIGTSVYSVASTETGFLVKENTSAPSMGVQVTETFVDKAGHPISVRQSGKMGGADVGLSLDYDNGKVRGQAKLADGKAVPVNATVPANIIDDNVLQALLPQLPWTATSSWQLPVFSGAAGEIENQQLVVTDEVPVSIPAGKYDAYRVELRTETATVAFYIAKAAPHRVLKIVPGGAPFEFVRAK